MVSCLGKLLYEIGVALRSITPFVESFVSMSVDSSMKEY